MWARVDDGWWCHPKVIGLDAAARGVWISALSWSCHQRKQIVPRALLPMLQGDENAAAELVAAGLWNATEDGWEIHGWAEYQDLSTAEKRAIAGSKGGRRSGEARRSKAKQTPDLTSGNVEANPKQAEASAEAGPSLPIPSPPSPSQPSAICTSPQLSVVAEPLDDAAVEIEVRKAIGRAARQIAATDPTVQNPGAASGAIGQRLREQHHDEITTRVRQGDDLDDIVAWLADPLAGFLDDIGDHAAAPPRLRSVTAGPECETCGDSAWVSAPGESIATRCPDCNPDPLAGTQRDAGARA